MSEERQETVADIMSEMREYADSMEKHLIYDLSECSTDYLRVLADRIEDAINRENRTSEKSSAVGNAAKMREALEALVGVIDKCNSENPLWWHIGAKGVKPLKDARAALAKPPRNCDVLSDPQEALEAIHEDRCYVNNPIDERRLTVEWLFAEAKGATNGSK